MKKELFDKTKPKTGSWVKFGYEFNGQEFEDEGRLTNVSYGKVTIKSEKFHRDFWILNISSLKYIKN